MLRVLRQGQRWIMVAVILLVGGAFVFFLGSGGSLLQPGGPGDAVVRVGDRRIDARTFLRVRAGQENYYRELVGDAFDARAVSEQLDLATANVLVQNAILAQEAERLGLHVSDDEIKEYVRTLPAFQTENGFDPETFRNFIDYEYGTERSFIHTIRRDLLVQKMLTLLSGSVEVSEGEVRERIRYERESVRIAFLTLDPDQPPADLEIPEGEVDEFIRNEQERLLALYAEREEQYDRPERVRARHILVRVPADAEPEEEQVTRLEIEGLRQQLEQGADFAELARAESEDEGTAGRGGDLGFFARGRMVEAFDEVAFGLEPGQLSEPVRTTFGFHLIRVEERQEARKIPFEEAQRELARELIGKRAGALRAERQRDAILAAIEEGRTLEQAARAEGLTLGRTGLIQRRPDGFIPEIGEAPEVMAAAFALDEAAPTAQQTFDVGGRTVLIQLLERRTPSEQEIEENLAESREQLEQEKRVRLQSAWVERRRQELFDAGQLAINLELVRQ